MISGLSCLPCPPAKLLALALGLVLSCHATCRAADPIDFDRQIRSILSENCFHCHGPDAESRQAGLRLDTREGALNGTAIVAGQSAASEVIRRIRSTDPDEQMPPPNSNRRLTPQQQDLLARWIDDGAPWSEHWAFVAPRRPVVPSTSADGNAANPIDAFILAALPSRGLALAPEADRGRLLRRVSLDLTGLPPSVAEYEAFLADDRPGAYERVVDRLFTSPRYGERMLWDWLDAARYADTNGYQGDPTRPMWYWRDWALAALNANVPFDAFSIEQLAGDLLPTPTREQLIATGFHRNHMINGEGGRIAEESRVDYVQDRVETTGTVWLGLTFNCCRCHDHKFDALTQREYYQLAAYFNSIDESGANDARGLANPVLSLATEAQQARLAELQQLEREAQQSLAGIEKQVRDTQEAWERSLVTADPEEPSTSHSLKINWKPLVPTSLTAQQGTTLTVGPEGVVTATEVSPPQDVYSMLFAPPSGTVTALRLEALPDDSLVNRGPGRADNGNFVLSGFVVEVYGRALELDPVRADFEQAGWSIGGLVDGKPNTGWAILPKFGESHELIVALRSPLVVPVGEVLTIRLAFESPHVQHTLGKFRLSYSQDAVELIRGIPAAVASALTKPRDQRTADEQKTITDHYVGSHPEVLAARSALDKAKSTKENYERGLPRTMVMRERAQPRETHILIRGAYDKYGEQVTHGTPAVLPSLPAAAPANRLALAEWLVASENPLTSRVVVNRIWQAFFGVGLVKTTEDFGVQGEQPSHPELLDWLAVEFMESGWDVRHIQRLIVTSATYRQTSRTTPELLEQDPENRWLARGPRYRRPSWMLRDQALAVSGLLVEQLGGPPVKGYQPEGIWEEATFGKIRYEQEHGAALYRRSLYQFWRRIVGPTVFFDVAARQTCTVKVPITNTPLHALVTLNDTTYVEAARKFAERVLTEGGETTPERLQFAFKACLSRPPRDTEVAVLSRRIDQLRQHYAADSANAVSLLQVGESPYDSQLPTDELAAWTGVASILFNLDEMLSKE